MRTAGFNLWMAVSVTIMLMIALMRILFSLGKGHCPSHATTGQNPDGQGQNQGWYYQKIRQRIPNTHALCLPHKNRNVKPERARVKSLAL